MARPRVKAAPDAGPPVAIPAGADAVRAYATWLEWLTTERRASRHTIAAYGRDIALFFAFLADHRGGPADLAELTQLRTGDFRAWLAARLGSGHVAASNARALSVLRNFFRWLDRQGLAHNPHLAALRTPKLPHAVPKPLSVPDAAAAVESIGHLSEEPWIAARDTALTMLLYGAGLRIDEALSLDRDVLPLRESLTVLGKGRKQRVVPLLAGGARGDRRLRGALPLSARPRRGAVPGCARQAAAGGRRAGAAPQAARVAGPA